MFNSMKIKFRESNFELLRIFAMFLIILSHVVVHGVYPYWHNNISTLDHFNNIVAIFFRTGQIGVTLFVLLTGYFSCQQEFKLKKWLDIYLKTLFFSVFLLGVYFFITPEQAQNTVIDSIFPFTHNAYWFITSWLLLYIFSPLLNTILKSHSSKTIRNYLILGTLLWVISPIFGLNKGNGYSNLIYFIYLYLLGSAIRLKYIVFPKSKFFKGYILGLFCFFVIMITVGIYFLSNKITLGLFSEYTNLNALYTLSISLWIFYMFKGIKIKSGFINFLASSTFSVYLLHDNKLVRTFLWHTCLKMDIAMNSPLFVIWALFISLSVLMICITIDKFMIFIYAPLIGYVENKISKIKGLQKYF